MLNGATLSIGTLKFGNHWSIDWAPRGGRGGQMAQNLGIVQGLSSVEVSVHLFCMWPS